MKNTKTLTLGLIATFSLLPVVIFAQTTPPPISQADIDAAIAKASAQKASLASSTATYQAQLANFKAQFEKLNNAGTQNSVQARTDVINTLQSMIDSNRGIIPDVTLNALSEQITGNKTSTSQVGVTNTTSASTPSSVSFSRNLKQGDQGEDVRLLQRILNTDPDTRISTEGAGSPGQETDFFGKKTYFAVISFQNKYYKEVLLPAGLEVGNGFVGQYTRNKLAELLIKGVLPNY